jgi:hypothetical protein
MKMKGKDKIKEKCSDIDKPKVINESMIPIISPEVTIREELEEDGRYMLFNAENELILMINATGKFILYSCDGENTIAQLVKKIEDNFTVKEDMDLLAITKNYISTLLKAKLVKIKEEEKK